MTLLYKGERKGYCPVKKSPSSRSFCGGKAEKTVQAHRQTHRAASETPGRGRTKHQLAVGTQRGSGPARKEEGEAMLAPLGFMTPVSCRPVSPKPGEEGQSNQAHRNKDTLTARMGGQP